MLSLNPINVRHGAHKTDALKNNLMKQAGNAAGFQAWPGSDAVSFG